MLWLSRARRVGLVLGVVSLLLILGLCRGRAEAQPTVPEPTVPTVPQSSVPPDVVLTLDGGMMRGTIVESVPGTRVVITLSNGESRTVPWGSVRYAGPDADRPSLARGLSSPSGRSSPSDRSTPESEFGAVAEDPPRRRRAERAARRADGGDVRVRVVSELRGFQLLRLAGVSNASARAGLLGPRVSATAQHYEQLCGMPCSLDLAPGTYEFALGRRGNITRMSSLGVYRDGTLTAGASSRAGVRVAGALTALIGAGVAAPLVLVPFGDNDISDSDLPFVLAGAAVGLFTLIIGFAMMGLRDRLFIRFD